MSFLTACVTVKVDGIVSNGCVWTDPINLSESTISALEPGLRQGDRNIRLDLEAIDAHNKKYDANCPKTSTE